MPTEDSMEEEEGISPEPVPEDEEDAKGRAVKPMKLVIRETSLVFDQDYDEDEENGDVNERGSKTLASQRKQRKVYELKKPAQILMMGENLSQEDINSSGEGYPSQSSERCEVIEVVEDDDVVGEQFEIHDVDSHLSNSPDDMNVVVGATADVPIELN